MPSELVFSPCCCAVCLLPDYYFCSLCIYLSPDHSFTRYFSFSFSVIFLFACGARSCWSESIGFGWLCEGCSCWVCSGSARGGSWRQIRRQITRWEVDREDQNHAWFATHEHCSKWCPAPLHGDLTLGDADRSLPYPGCLLGCSAVFPCVCVMKVSFLSSAEFGFESLD